MLDIPRILKVPPLLMGEDITPGAATTNENFESIYSLHAIDLTYS